MGKLLGNAPVKILKICARDDVRRFSAAGRTRRGEHLRRLQTRFKADVEGEIVFRSQVRQRRGILRWERFAKGLERFQGHHPRRNACAKVLGQKRTERLIFPGLNVARAPIIHQH